MNDTLSPESTPQKRRGRPPKTPPTPQTQPKKNFRGARSRQAASRENDSSDMDLRHDSSLENMDITPEVSMDGVNAEEDNQLSTLRVRRKPNKRERR